MDWIEEILSFEAVRLAIAAAAVGGVLHLMKRSAGLPAPASAAGNVHTLKYGWLFPAIGYMAIGFAAVIAILASFVGTPQPGDDWIVVGMAAAFAGLGGCLVNEARRRVLLSKEGVEAISPWGRTVRLPWPEVSSVAFSRRSQQFMIRGRSGRTVRVNALLTGMPTFVDHLRQRLPPEAYADALDRYAQYAGEV